YHHLSLIINRQLPVTTSKSFHHVSNSYVMFLNITPLLPQSTLFPYTTLFRSAECSPRCSPITRPSFAACARTWKPPPSSATPARSEEHTSELQSPCNLVCRLLLEKKKFIINRLEIFRH